VPNIFCLFLMLYVIYNFIIYLFNWHLFLTLVYTMRSNDLLNYVTNVNKPQSSCCFITFILEDVHMLSLGMLIHIKRINEFWCLFCDITRYLHDI
jgi:hypothetical protein